MREVLSSNPGDASRHVTGLELHLLISNTAYCNISRLTGRLVDSRSNVSLDTRQKCSLILSQDSVGGLLEDDSPREVAGQYRCLPNQERVTE